MSRQKDRKTQEKRENQNITPHASHLKLDTILFASDGLLIFAIEPSLPSPWPPYELHARQDAEEELVPSNRPQALWSQLSLPRSILYGGNVVKRRHAHWTTTPSDEDPDSFPCPSHLRRIIEPQAPNYRKPPIWESQKTPIQRADSANQGGDGTDYSWSHCLSTWHMR